MNPNERFNYVKYSLNSKLSSDMRTSFCQPATRIGQSKSLDNLKLSLY